jgi:Lysyl oxidase
VTTGTETRYVLAFTARVENVGPGPLVITGERVSAAAPAMSVTQTLMYSDGTAVVLRVPGKMRYEPGGHSHWHLLEFMVYELRNATSNELVRPDQKTGFCVGDRYRSPASVPNRPARAMMTEECGRRDPNVLRFVSGISPGYGEIYEPIVEGQFIDVTGLPAGRYVLVHRTNATRALEEIEWGNNNASALIELSYPAGAGAEPTLRVVASCEDSARCVARS